MKRKHSYVIVHLFTGIITVACLQVFSCSKPTKPLSPDEILEALLDLPPYPSPPLTDENASNESYQIVVQTCESPEVVLWGYRSWIQAFIGQEIEANSIEGGWRWVLNGWGMVITLTVVQSDTLIFQMDRNNSGEHFITNGWVIPGSCATSLL